MANAIAPAIAPASRLLWHLPCVCYRVRNAPIPSHPYPVSTRTFSLRTSLASTTPDDDIPF